MNQLQASNNIKYSATHGAAAIINHAKIPTREQLIKMTLKAQQGDERAQEQVILMTCRMAYKLAESYYRKWAPKLPASASFCDVFQAAIEGLIKAIHKYDPDTGNTFTTCANHWIKNSIQRQGIYPLLSSIRIPESIIISGIPAETSALSINDHSIDDPDNAHAATIESPTNHIKEKEAIMHIEQIMEKLEKIDPRLPGIIRLTMQGYNVEVAANHYGLSRERIRQLRIKAQQEFVSI